MEGKSSSYFTDIAKLLIDLSSRGFNLDGQPTDQPGSSNTQSIGNERNSNSNILGSQSSSETPAPSNGNSMGGQSGSAPQSVSSSIDASSFDPSMY